MLHRLDDHYNQSRYRLETLRGCHLFTRQEGQRWNYPFLFNRQARMSHWFKNQQGHRDQWFLEEKKI